MGLPRLHLARTALRKRSVRVRAAARDLAVPALVVVAVWIAPPEQTEAVATLGAVPLSVWCHRRMR